MEEKLFKIYYGETGDEYISRYLKDDDIINGYLTEAKAFEIFFDDMIMCNDIYKLQEHYFIDELISAYNEEEDYYKDEYQFFIVNIAYDEDLTKKAVEKMGNTLYFIDDLGLYYTGICDWGTSRTIVPTDIKVIEIEEGL